MPDAGLLKGMSISSLLTLCRTMDQMRFYIKNLQRTTKWMQLYSQLIDELRAAKDPLDPKVGRFTITAWFIVGVGCAQHTAPKMCHAF